MDPASRARRIREALPEEGLFAGMTWRISPEPFPLEKRTVKTLAKLGPLLHRYQKASDLIYRRSRRGTLPSWIAAYLDAGKPGELLETGLKGSQVEALPSVIRPDLILTDDGFSVTELDSVPGGIGLTAWLSQRYAEWYPEKRIVGETDGMIRGFQSIFQSDEVDILVSDEAASYRPEMEWLAEAMTGDTRVHRAEIYEPVPGRDGYRFFELFDLPNLPNAMALGEAAARGEVRLTSPFKPWIEEKMWAALLWSLPLAETWRQELREANFNRLKTLFPRSWIVEPLDLPHQAAIPGLEIQDFAELKSFSQTERELVLKLSGFNEKAWGSRSVTIGHDSSSGEWSRAVDDALAGASHSPYVLQRFHQGRKIRHPWLDEETGTIEVMEGRVRLCPYYFVAAETDQVELGGVLATIVPADKKVIHGMSDAILVPCSLE